MVNPRNQPTVAAPKSSPPVLIFAAVAAVVVVWGASSFWFAFKRSSSESAEPAAPAPPPTPATSAIAQAPQPRPSPEPAPADEPVAAPPTPPDQVLPLPQRVTTLNPRHLDMDACQRAVVASGITLPEDFEVLATGAYQGRSTGLRYEQPGHLVGQIDVVVNSTSRPIALMLGAYEPTNWNVSWTSGTRIIAVYVGGYHAQRVDGLLPNMPRLVSSYDQKSPCPYFYIGGDEGLPKVNPAARRVFGRPVDMAYPVDKDGTVFVGSARPLQRGPSIENSRKDFSSLSGKDALEDEIRKGRLRRAGVADAELWAKATGQHNDLPPVAGVSEARTLPPPSNVYVVQSREFVFPDGLYGAHAVIFIVPPGLPRPRGNPGHSMVYELSR